MNVQRLVFRLKEIPYSVNTSEEVAQFLANALVDVDPTDIVVQSLATSLNSWTKPSDRSTKVATLMFKRTPRLLDDEPIDGGWCIDPDGSSLCLDTNFLGLTPLNDVEPSIHVGDCVAISGLSSHPFGSWQPKGSDKKFMWIRDCLPRKLPLVRVILYGQDSRLEKSGSFQQLDDMARDLLQSIRQLDKAKRLIFLGHSLGGLILKEAIVQLKTSPDGNDYRILKRIEGAVCFGVPNLGMEQNHFLAVTKGARNEVLIRDIEKTSNYIAKLDRMYTDDDDLRTLRFIWAYETLESCTTIEQDGKLSRDGPKEVLVDRFSATYRMVNKNGSITFPINKTHSDMVKFGPTSHYLDIVTSKIVHLLIGQLDIALQDLRSDVAECGLNNQERTSLQGFTRSCQGISDTLQTILLKTSKIDSDDGILHDQPGRVWKQSWDSKDARKLRSQITASLTLLREIPNEITIATEKMARVDRHLNSQERDFILNWITPINEGFQQDYFIEQRQAETGRWLLESPEFQTWLLGDELTLFCKGNPGAGKTIITSIVIDELMIRFRDDMKIGIAYIYCNFRRTHEQHAKDLLACLLKQLGRSLYSLPESLQGLYEKHRDRGTRPSYDEIVQTLQSVIPLYPRVYIVIDALDECEDSCRSTFLEEIFTLREKYGVKVFATSRPTPNIRKQFEGSMSLEIRAEKEDMKKYLVGNIGKLRSFHYWDLELQNEITNTILELADGMFLLARIYLYSLEGKGPKKKVRSTLAQFQKRKSRSIEEETNALDPEYEDVMKRINEQNDNCRILAKKVLLWITCARRPLTTLELQHALAVEPNESYLDEDNVDRVEEIVSVCVGLVVVKQEGIIELVHYTTQEYFERTQKHWFPNAQSEIVEICVSYLSFDDFETGCCSTTWEFEDRLGFNPFYDYAAKYWGHHACGISSLDEPRILKFLSSTRKTSASFQAIMAPDYFDNELGTNVSALHLVAHFGLSDLVLALLRNGHELNVKDSNGRTPLSWAAQRGHDMIVQQLLTTKGIDADLKGDCMSPQVGTGKGGWEKQRFPLAKLILSNDWEWDSCGATPLWYAARNGHESTFKHLLNHGSVDLSSRDEDFGTTPLWCASANGHEAIVKLLLEKSVDPNQGDGNGLTPLSVASWEGQEATVRLLLQSEGVKPNLAGIEGQTPLMIAALAGHAVILELLLADHRVNTNLIDEYGRTALSIAVCSGHDRVVELLLAKDGVDVNAINPYKKSAPLDCAVKEGHEKIVKLLLADKRVDVNSSGTGWTPLMHAVDGGRNNLVKLLIATDKVNVNYQGEDGETALLMAVRQKQDVAAKLLLGVDGIDLGVDSKMDSAELVVAVISGHEEVVRLLIDKGLDIDSKNRFGYTMLLYATTFRQENIVKLLLEKGANVELLDSGGITPLIDASRRGCEAIVELLLKGGANVHSSDHKGWTALSYATSNSHGNIIKLLLEKGANPVWQNNKAEQH